MPSQPTGTVTFLFTDIEGSTRLWEQDPTRMRDVLSRHDQLLRDAIGGHGGYVFSTAGDAFSSAFSDPVDAVTAAIEAQRSIGDEKWPVGEVRVRMSLHSGGAHERDGDYFGPTLNRAARILSAGHGGQVLSSQTTRDLLSDRLPADVDLRPLGEHRLKDLGRPEHLYQVAHPDLAESFPTLNTLDSHLNNLPIELSSFVGRKDELAETTKRLADSRLVTLTGVGGSGKTRLALQTAAELFDRFPDGVWVAEMAGLADQARFPHWVAEEIGIVRSTQSGLSASGDDRSPMQMIEDYLGSRVALLILDNCEHLIRASAEFAERMLRACPGLRILATSREGLGIRGEYLIQVPSLGLPSVLGDDAEEGPYPDAMELFAERAAAANARFTMDDHTVPVVADICSRLDGMPLAIELAAARTRMLTVDQIAQRLDDTFRLLTGGSRTALPRQQTLLATVDWSYQLLTEPERLIFQRLAVFRSGFSLETAEAVVSGDGVEDFEVFDLLASLVDKSMILGGSDSGRFSLLETLRQFALGKLTDAGSGDEWRFRHAEYFASVADEASAGGTGPDQLDWLNRLDRDKDNFDAALTWSIESGRYLIAARLAAGLWWYWTPRGRGKEGQEAMDAIAPHIDDIPSELRARFLVGRSWITGFNTTSDRGITDSERALAIADELESPQLRGMALLTMALAHGHVNRHDDALHHHRQAYLAFEESGDEWGMGWATQFSAWIYRMQANVEESERRLEQARRHFRAAGTQIGLAWVSGTLGIIRRYANDFEGAVRLHEEAAQIMRKLGNREAEAFNLVTAAISLDQWGRTDEALAAGMRGLEIYRDLGQMPIEVLSIVAMLARHTGDIRGAVEYITEVTGQLPESGPSDFAVVAEEIADIAVELGMHEPAAHLVAYAAAERIRVNRPIPPQFQPERSRTEAAIRSHVDLFNAILREWTTKEMADAVPIAQATIARFARALDSS